MRARCRRHFLSIAAAPYASTSGSPSAPRGSGRAASTLSSDRAASGRGASNGAAVSEESARCSLAGIRGEWKACRPQIGSGLRTRLRCRLARAAAALASSRRGRSAIVRTGGRLATSISTHATRSASAGGCRKSGWLTTASRRLPDRRVQNVWSVTVYVRSVLITSTVDPSKRYTRSYLAGGLARSSVPTNRKSRAARRARWGVRSVRRALG